MPRIFGTGIDFGIDAFVQLLSLRVVEEGFSLRVAPLDGRFPAS